MVPHHQPVILMTIIYPIRITISHYLPSVGYLQWLPSTKMIWGKPRTWFTFMLGFPSMYIVVDRAFSWSFKVSLDLFICEWWHCDFASVCQPPSPPSPPAPFRILFATLRLQWELQSRFNENSFCPHQICVLLWIIQYLHEIALMFTTLGGMTIF